VCEEWQCLSSRGITDLGKSIDRDRRIYLLEGQKWRDEMNEGKERDIEKKCLIAAGGELAGEQERKKTCVCVCVATLL